MKKHFKTLLGILIITGFLILPFLVFAQDANSRPGLKDAFTNVQKSVGDGAGYKTGNVDLFDVIVELIKLTLSVLGVIFIILIIYSGFTWMTAGGSEEKVGKSKTILKNSALGLIIVLGAYSISFFVVEALSFLNSVK